MKKQLWYTDKQQAEIDRLHALLTAEGINTRDPKGGGFSDSALFRWLVEQKLTEMEAEKGGKG